MPAPTCSRPDEPLKEDLADLRARPSPAQGGEGTGVGRRFLYH